MASKQYTNREDVFVADPENWEYLPDADKPVGGEGSSNPVFAPGATEETISAPGAQAGGMEMQPALVPPDPRLGMNPQGEWTEEKTRGMFPEMFQDTSQWLDPAEEAKKRMGLPYDKTKRYDENKLYPGINGPAVPGMDRPDVRPPILRASRDQWEQHVFKKIGGNPALMNPYEEVIKADKNLPELFNHVFQGRAVWSDLAKLNKEEREYWDTIKKQYHERILKEAVGKKQQMEQAYKWMMGQWAYEQKEAAAELSKQDKLRARQATADGKAPPHLMLYNEKGELTLHERQPDGSWVDRGLRGHEVTPRDVEPSAVKTARKDLAALVPALSPNEKIMYGFMNAEQRKQFDASRSVNLSPADQKRAEEIRSFLDKFDAAERAKIQQKLTPATNTVTDGSKPATKPKSNYRKDIALIVNAKKQSHPKLKQAIDAFWANYPEDATRRQLMEALSKIKGSHYTPRTGIH